MSQNPDLTLVFDDGELQVHARVLCLASPVLDAMLSSDMAESHSRQVNVDITSKKTFARLYKLLLPCAWKPSEITEDNFEELLKLSDYYQVSAVKERCAEVLGSLPTTVPRLLLARDYRLPELYQKFSKGLASRCSPDVATQLKSDKAAADGVLSILANGQVQVSTTNVDCLLDLIAWRRSAETDEEVNDAASTSCPMSLGKLDLNAALEHCVQKYMLLPATVPRLIRAKKLGLQAAMDEFAGSMTRRIGQFDLSPLEEHPDLILDLFKRTQRLINEGHPYHSDTAMSCSAL
eukprot:CAMPEP_0179069940 /NCGR_PEP_ID=MMETSP0796-20121207/30765_1 /TAXON_ID=73915 /ORGANISM="Pyrodinium bahamense, Strain pbaha01" /LENGTH=291 /DNA_ID=CAMNT_0020767019 /DNA_START=15 /DNA_END=890 /DNA_ORIENTATION=-